MQGPNPPMHGQALPPPTLNPVNRSPKPNLALKLARAELLAEQIQQQALNSSIPDRLGAGFATGWRNAIEDVPVPRSIIVDTITNNHPYNVGKIDSVAGVGQVAGRVAGDFFGNGSIRKLIWNATFPDMISTQGRRITSEVATNKTIPTLAAFGGVVAANMGSNNFNPLNIGEVGRTVGYSATNPDPEDPRQSTNIPLEIVDRYLGRTGRLLPWEQFKQERPDVSYEKYEDYQNYLRDRGFLGVVKGTLDGVDGAEMRILGSRITPLGALGAAGVIGGTLLALRKGKV